MLKKNKIHIGDCRKLIKKIPDSSINLIITDPPYSKEFNWVWGWLAEEGNRVLKENSHLITLLGHDQLPIAIKALNKTLRYWWICGLENKRSNKMFGKNVIIKFKPALWFLKGKRGRENEGYFPMDFISDVSESFKTQKKKHKWAQPPEFFENFIIHLTKEDDLILDMFAGSGTAGDSCLKLKRNFILIDNDEKCKREF